MKKRGGGEERRVGGEGEPHFEILISIIIGIHIKMLCFKFKQDRTIHEEFYFFECGKREGGRGRGPHFLILI